MKGTTNTNVLERINGVEGVKEAFLFGQVISVEFENGLYAAIIAGKKYSITLSEETAIGTYGTELSEVEMFDWVHCAADLVRNAA